MLSGTNKPSVEDNRSFTAEEYAVFENEAEGAGEDDLLDVAASLDEFLRGVRMVHGDDLLDNDGPFVEFGGDNMSGCPDDFHATLESLVVWPCTGKSGQEGVMNVQHPVGPVSYEARAEDAHVFGEHQPFRM